MPKKLFDQQRGLLFTQWKTTKPNAKNPAQGRGFLEVILSNLKV